MIEVRLEGVRGVAASWVRQAVQKTLKREKAPRTKVAVLVTTDRRIRGINKRFLKHDYATDVISFNLDEKGYLGDLVVSADTARRVAKELGIGFREELSRYLVHGTLHLLGYEDKKPQDFRRMHGRQESILEAL